MPTNFVTLEHKIIHILPSLMNQKIITNRSNEAVTFSEPMTWDESLRYIENLESNKFAYEEWEIARDLNFTKHLDELIENCDPRLKQ